MKKGGQVTIFILLGIFIVAIATLLFLIPKNMENPQEVDTNRISFYVNSLIEDEAFKCLQQIGKKGGYYNIPNQLYVNETAYWYYEGINTQPFLNIIENETSICIDELLKNTTYLVLDIFGNDSVKISKDRISSKVKIGEWRTAIEVDYPIVVSKGNSNSIISDFKVSYKINLLKIYELATGIVNYASIPEFDKCNPSKNCYGENINFSFFNEGENLFIKGQTFAIFSNQSKEEPFELNFAIKRPIKEAFREGGKRLAVLYQDTENLPTFGGKAIDVLKNTGLELVDYYGCEGISKFISQINDYDIVIITGNLQYQIRGGLSSVPEENELLEGCDEFNAPERKIKLKNWINLGGSLWINGVGRGESDFYGFSYLGCLGYTSKDWTRVDLGSYEENQRREILEGRKTIPNEDLSSNQNYLLTCPNDLRKNLGGTWILGSPKITDKDKIILGTKEEPIIWINELGNGFIIFDQFLLKDNLYSKLDFNDDLYSKGLAEEYFVNVLNYLAKYEEYKKAQLEISLISPSNDKEIENPIFYFQSLFGKNVSYTLLITDKYGKTNSLKLEERDLIEDSFSKNKFKIDLTNKTIWTELNEERYEWQIKANNSFSDLGNFRKKLSAQVDNNVGEGETNEN